MIALLKKLALYTLAIGSLSLASRQSFAQNKNDVTCKIMPAAYSQDLEQIQNQLQQAELDENPMAKKITDRQFKDEEIIHWGNINNPETKDFYISEILQQAEEEHKFYLDFEMDNEKYIMTIQDLKELHEAHLAYYDPKETAGYDIDITLAADNDFVFDHVSQTSMLSTTIAAHMFPYFNKKTIIDLCAHEAVGHYKNELNSSASDDPDIQAASSIECEYNADKGAFKTIGKDRYIKAITSLAGYINFRAENEKDPVKKVEWQIQQQEALDFLRPKRLLDDPHPSLANRILYQEALDDAKRHNQNLDQIPFPPPQYYQPLKIKSKF